MLKRMYDRIGAKAHSPHAGLLIGVLFYIEAIFFLPVDPILIMYCLERRDRAMWYATIATVWSVLGGITGYLMGLLLWNQWGIQIIHSRFVSYVLTEENFYYLKNLYQQYEGMAILAAAFTPIPYKAATLTAGFCKLNFIPFVFWSLIGRGARFYLYGITIALWGHHIKSYIDRYFSFIIFIVSLIIIGLFWLFKF